MQRWILLFTAVGLLAGNAQSDESPTIYKWVDANGIAHYTTDRDRIPKSLSNRIQSIERTRQSPGPEETDIARSRIVPSDNWVSRDAPPLLDQAESPPLEFEVIEDGTGEAAQAPVQQASVADLQSRAAELSALDTQIASLEEEIARDEEKLKLLISDASDEPLYDRQEFLEIARRLPELQENLASLRNQRSALDGP